MSPKTRAHQNAVTWLARWLMSAIDQQTFEVRIASPLSLGDSEPEPDLAVIAHDAPRPYHPSTATLIIEITVSSLDRDLGSKRRLHAAASVPENWALDLDRRRALIYRDLHGREYSDVLELDASAQATATAATLPALAVSDLLTAAYA